MRGATTFLPTFLAAWWLLDRLVTSPPMPLSAAASLAAAAAVLVLGQRASGVPWSKVPGSVGLGRPAVPALAVALAVGAVYVATLVLGATAAGVDLAVRDNWPAVLVGVLLFHGVAEELVWRGFVFGRLRQRHSFGRAVWWSVPLIAVTHAPIALTDGWLVGGLATLTAAVTCWPFAALWERGGRTVWAPALLHALIGCWQLFERTYPPTFSILVLVASVGVPLLAVVPWQRAPRRLATLGRGATSPPVSPVPHPNRRTS
jgi:membrane protease YdiL (CAAX protease family)